jgi:hypothetical protein
MRVVRWTIWLASTLCAFGLSACAPSPQAYIAEPLTGPMRIAVLPLANYSDSREAPERLGPMLAVALSQFQTVEVVEPGRVEEALSREPWLMIDRIPPDLVDTLGAEMGADAILLGAVLAYGLRDGPDGALPEVAISLRLLETPGGRVLWSAVHSRGGSDGETVFGLGRVTSLERLAADVVEEITKTFPARRGGKRARASTPAEEER